MGETLEADDGPRLRAWRRAAAQRMGVAEDRVDARPWRKPHRRGAGLTSRTLPGRHDTVKVALTGKGRGGPFGCVTDAIAAAQRMSVPEDWVCLRPVELWSSRKGL